MVVLEYLKDEVNSLPETMQLCRYFGRRAISVSLQ